MPGLKEVSNKQVILKNHVVGWPTEEDMELVTATKKLEVKEGSKEVVVKVLYLSCDPYMRGRMAGSTDSYVPPFEIGQPLSGNGIGKVILSSNPEYKENDLVVGLMNWEEYSVFSGELKLFSGERKIDKTEVPLSYWLGALGNAYEMQSTLPSVKARSYRKAARLDFYDDFHLLAHNFLGYAYKGMPGMTAYFGMFDICAPKKGETVYVSAASGAVGQMVGQFAKLAGCYVVGSAGSKQKIDLLTEKFKYDKAFNYKEEPDLDAALKSEDCLVATIGGPTELQIKEIFLIPRTMIMFHLETSSQKTALSLLPTNPQIRYCPKGIDVYFENVGGEMLDAVLLNMNVLGRIAACGMISQYNLDSPGGVYNLIEIVTKRIMMQGFIIHDHIEIFPEFKEKVLGWLKEGKLEVVEDIVCGIENGPKALIGMLSGKNVGKQTLKVADYI